MKHEGDGATPVGTWRTTGLLYRADRLIRPTTQLPCRPIRQDDGWCDDPTDRNYNRLITHPYTTRAERLWRDDDAYNLIVTLDYNTLPRKNGAGSAIFIHVAQKNFTPTEGCIALKQRALQILLSRMCRGTKIHIAA